jgi:hypothetical protein
VKQLLETGMDEFPRALIKNRAISRRSSCTFWLNSFMMLATVRFYRESELSKQRTSYYRRGHLCSMRAASEKSASWPPTFKIDGRIRPVLTQVRGQYMVVYLPDTEPLKIVSILQGARNASAQL